MALLYTHKWLYTLRSLGGVPCISLLLPTSFTMRCAYEGTMHTLKKPPLIDLFCLDNIFNFFLSPVLTLHWWIY